MAKKDKTEEVVDMFVGADTEDDLMDMTYMQEDGTPVVDTHPPETKAEAETRAEMEKAAEETKDEKPAEEGEAEAEEAPPVEEEPVAEEEAAPEDDKKVPYERFDEVNKKRKAAEEEAARLKEQLETLVEEKTPEPEPEPYDYAAQEKAAMDALLEGDQDKYAQLRAEIRAAEREETLREARRIASEGDKHLQENLTFEEAGERIEAQYPQFSQDSDVYNDTAREEMLDLYVGYAKSGLYTRVQALQKAADNAAKIHALPEPEPDNVITMKQPDTKKKIKAAKDQPPAMEGRAAEGEAEGHRDLNSMSDEEYEALPESTKRRMRGDFL